MADHVVPGRWPGTTHMVGGVGDPAFDP